MNPPEPNPNKPTATPRSEGVVTAAELNAALDRHVAPKKKKGPKNQKTAEHLYADLIKSGQVRIERRRGKPPLIVWL